VTTSSPITHALVQIVDTPDGPFTIVESDGRVLASGWTSDVDAALARIPADLRPGNWSAGQAESADAVDAYYAGDLHAIDEVPVLQSGGPFRTVAWQALRTIPAGSPLTYSGFAELVGRPTAIRAAASACATNAPALFVPCHRVLRTDGSLGGFAWGLPVKRALLDREAAAAATAA
jgi:methylated-DNA-[protein]-cysteine S-methyltransferase